MFHISRIKTAFTITLVLISLGSASIYIALAGAGAQIGAAPSSGMADTQGNTYLYLPIITRPFVSIGDDPDFNGDGFADLAIGAPGEELGGSRGAGAANVLYGSWSVLSATNDQFWYQGLNNVEGSSALGDHFAWAVAVGDFNSDGYDDLALGVPDENNRGTTEASGAVNVLYGQSSGISDTNDELWNQNTEGIQDGAEERDFYGKALAAGDFDGDGIDDLAVGVPEEDIDSKANAGAVNVIYGTSGGLDGAGDQLWTQTNTGDATSGTQDMFGSSVAVGDFDGDGFDDLAIGVPFKEIWTDPNTLITEAGAVHVLYGSSSSLTGNNSDYWHQAITNTLDTPETSDRYGSALTVGDFNADGYDDLAVGIPLEDIGGVLDAGAVHVLYGSASGLAVTSDQLWYQGLLANASDDTDDQFGAALSAGDFNADGYDDLAVGAPNEAVGSVLCAGSVNVIFGSADGLAASGSQYWDQDVSGIADQAETCDNFGFSLSAADFNADGFKDLVIGVPNEDIGSEADVGAVHVLYGSMTGLTADSNQFWTQDSANVEDTSEVNDWFGFALP